MICTSCLFPVTSIPEPYRYNKDNGRQAYSILIEQLNALLHLLDCNTGKGSQLDPCWHQNDHIAVYQQQRNARRRRWKWRREGSEDGVRGTMRWKIDTDEGGESLTGNHTGWHESLHWFNSLSGNVPFYLTPTP